MKAERTATMSGGTDSLKRSRWAAIGAAVAVAIGAGGIGIAGAADDAATYTPITPCRLMDTRPGEDLNTGPRDTPIGENESHTVVAHGSQGDCTIPSAANGLAVNITTVGPSKNTDLVLWPTGSAKPNSSNINPSTATPVAVNAANVALGGGSFDIWNRYGQVDVIIDVAGYYTDYSGHNHDDRYYTQAEVDAALADLAPELPAPVQDRPAVDAGFNPDGGGDTAYNVAITSDDPTVINSVELSLPSACATATYDVIVTASGHTHYRSSHGTDAELRLEVDDEIQHIATLEVQLHPDHAVAPEIPYSRTIMLTLAAGDHTIEWTAEKEYSSSDAYNVRNPILLAQPVAVSC